MSFIKDTFFGGAEKKAAEAQARSGREAIASNERALGVARQDLEPFRSAGGKALNALVDFVKTGPDVSLERAEGFTNIQNSAAAGGKLRSGGTLKRLTEFNSILNSRNRGQRFNELFNLSTLGSNAASGQATATLGTADRNAETITGIGNARAAGIVGGANNTRNTLFSILQLALNRGGAAAA